MTQTPPVMPMTRAMTRKNRLRAFGYVWICVYAINNAQGLLTAFWQCLVILFAMNLVDRFLIDELWVGHTKAWIIPGTEEFLPYIKGRQAQEVACQYG